MNILKMAAGLWLSAFSLVGLLLILPIAEHFGDASYLILPVLLPGSVYVLVRGIRLVQEGHKP